MHEHCLVSSHACAILQEVISKWRMVIPNLPKLFTLFTTVYTAKEQNTHSRNIIWGPTLNTRYIQIALHYGIIFSGLLPNLILSSQQPHGPHLRAAEHRLRSDASGGGARSPPDRAASTHSASRRAAGAHRGPFADSRPQLHWGARRFVLPETKRLLKEGKMTEKHTSDVLTIVRCCCCCWYPSFRSKNPLYCSTGSQQQ